jgi:hypothetical protein
MAGTNPVLTLLIYVVVLNDGLEETTMKRMTSAAFAAFAAFTCLVLPAGIQPANAAPMPSAMHQMQVPVQVDEAPVILARHGMRGRHMGRGGYYGRGRHYNRGRHLGWQRGRHQGWNRQWRGR